MPVFIAFAAFLLLIFGPRLGLPLGPWVVTTGPFGPKRKTPGQKSGVRTEALEMVLEHDSGQMEGTCLKGRFAGKSLSSLSRHELLQLLEELRGTDAKGVLLLEAYLDRRAPGWRDLRSGHSDREGPRQSPRGRGGMSTNDAYELLGLKPGAKEAEIRAAHRRLMMKFHPDQGGSTYLAARINEAKEILLTRR
ncbi:MAG TPA: DnaJ domain-containing protein [Candidatus Binatia bacterium]|nr:DnaJ domain-containing protein [Candidatus Binatia bacterium]